MARKPKGKTPLKSSAAQMQKPSHGNGMLQVGNPGNAGGTGRPRSAVRRAALKSFDKRIPMLERIADSATAKDSDVIAATKALGWAGGVDKEPAIDGELIGELAASLEAELPNDMEEVKIRIYERWAVTLGRYAAGEA